MHKTLVAGVAAVTMTLGFAGIAQAKCYKFSSTPSDVYVCVGKNGSDSFADRKKGKEVLKKALGSDPGNVSSYSSSCHSNSNKCYDENGKAHRSLKGY